MAKLTCIRHEPPDIDQKGLDQHTLNWVQTLNQSGKAFLTPAKLDDKWMVRVSMGVESTEREHVDTLWTLVQEHAETSMHSLNQSGS
ncbi:MAG: hypothetical protein AAF402_15010 [Pseudomonadota bacterium]